MRQRGIDCVVDHTIPLNGEDVCGLHVETNLQIVTTADNVAKRNTQRFIPELFRLARPQLSLF